MPLSGLPGGQRPFPGMMVVMMELTCARSRYNHLFASILFAKQVLHTRLLLAFRNVATRMNNILQDNNANPNQASPADSITLGQLKAMVGTVQKPKVCFLSLFLIGGANRGCCSNPFMTLNTMTRIPS